MASQDATNRYNGQLIPLFSLTVMNASTLPDVEQARFNMVEQQVRPWDVLDANVLQALFDVRREQFVPPALRALAFSDLEIRCRSTASTPGRTCWPRRSRRAWLRNFS